MFLLTPSPVLVKMTLLLGGDLLLSGADPQIGRTINMNILIFSKFYKTKLANIGKCYCVRYFLGNIFKALCIRFNPRVRGLLGLKRDFVMSM